MPVLVDHEKTRQQIAELAVGIIADEGIQGLTIRRIAEAAGTSRAIVSTYFRDKPGFRSPWTFEGLSEQVP